MTLKQLLETDGVTTLKWIYVNIIQLLSYNQFIVADSTGLAIMQVDEKIKKEIEVGQGLKLVKPRKIDDISFIMENASVRTKPMVLRKLDKTEMEELSQKAANVQKTQKPKYTEFNSIINNYGENTIVDTVLIMVSKISRLIQGRFGDYRIVSIIDATSAPLTMNLYVPFLEKLEENQVFVLTNLKKKILEHDKSVRLTTTRFTKIESPSLDEKELFHKYKEVKHAIEGYCIMYTDLSCYQSCPKHKTKLNDDRYCNGCKTKRSDSNRDFHCFLHVDHHNDLTPILIFKSHLSISGNMSELDTEHLLELLVINQKIKVHFNKKGETNVATKVELNYD